MNDSDDRQLLLSTHAGDEPAARALWARHFPRLTAYAAAIVPPGLSPEDIVQTAMCSVLGQSRRTLKGVENVPAWLTLLVRNAALNAVRSARRERGRTRQFARLQTDSRRGAPGAANAPEDLKAAVETLPRRLREAVVLRHVSGLTFDQMALALGANRNTVAARYRAALERLRELLGRSAPVEPDFAAEPAEVSNG